MHLASIFSDNMVFQANKPIRIFGTGQGSFSVRMGDSCVSGVSNDEEWCVELPKMSYGGPHELEFVQNGEKTLYKNIFIGEVWIAAGQSNMEMPLFRTSYGFDEAEYADIQNIHFFTVARRVDKDIPQYGYHFERTIGIQEPWQICDRENTLHFSAIGYYVAKELAKKLGIHIGIISCNWGATNIETWIKREYFEKSEVLKPILQDYYQESLELTEEEHTKLYQEYLDNWKYFYDHMPDGIVEEKKKGISATSSLLAVPIPADVRSGKYCKISPGVLFDSMTATILPYSIAGILWYQGESNSCFGYAEKYKAYMECMRDSFKDRDLPIYATELASFDLWWNETIPQQNSDNRFVEGNNWAFTREEQYRASEIYDNNYVITTMELGHLTDIHPPYKRELAHRFALKMLKYSYHFDIMADQPIYQSCKFVDGKAIIKTKNADGLYIATPESCKMFICDESHELKRANIRVEDNCIIAECDEVRNPTIVRYAFDLYYTGSHIYNSAGLPLAPFRTDT